ncbi:peptide synthetase [Wenjunlia tyrosinilytica]|uniref:Peptide synthetase n=1 Tax=Wenjunlia tyrosinilytica TaxID=1544741 RepID=A0A918E1M4_9ACTN|nr:peptide synthetase [Wenjunlia tyrosinilytica]GGO96630.1 hypothetical protein GCM10012280_56570 [Wenjunlia tyrosinilytica]
MGASKTGGPYQRPISPTEWFYLGAMGLAPPFAIQLVVEGHGRMDRSELSRAVAVASAACPGARLVRRGRIWVDSGQAPAVRVVDGTAIDRTRFENAEPLRSPLDPVNGPTCEVLVLAGEPCTVVFRAFHGVMDGRGVLTWMAEVFRALRGEEPVGARSGATERSLLSELGTTGARPRLGLNFRSPLDRAGVSAERVARPSFRWRRRTLDGNFPGLVARVAAAIANVEDAEEVRFMVPVDLRRHDAGLASTANLTLPVFVDGRTCDAAEDFHKRLRRALDERRELSRGTEQAAARLPLRALGTALAAANAVVTRRRRYVCSTLISNLGRVDLCGLSTAGFKASTVYSLAVRAPLTPASIVTVQAQGRTELTMSYPDGPGMGARADALFNRISDELCRVPPRSGPRTSHSGRTRTR